MGAPSFHSSSPFCFRPRQRSEWECPGDVLGGIFAPRSLQPSGVLGHPLQRSGHNPSALVEEHAWAQCRRTLSLHPTLSASAAILPLAVTLEKMGPQRRLVPTACGPHGHFLCSSSSPGSCLSLVVASQYCGEVLSLCSFGGRWAAGIPEILNILGSPNCLFRPVCERE